MQNELDENRPVMGLDPGRDKCGLAVVSEDGKVLLQQVIASGMLEEEVGNALKAHSPRILIMGNGTTGKQAKKRIEAAFPLLPIEVVDEYRTTEMARKEYWKTHPPTGWRRLLPTSMQSPPVPVDDFAAVILCKRVIGTVTYTR